MSQCRDYRFEFFEGSTGVKNYLQKSLCSLALMCLGATAHTAVFEGLYEAKVRDPGSDPDAQEAAFRSALALVLVRMSGQRDVMLLSEAAPILENASRYVQQYGGTDDGKLRVSFDGATLETDMAAYRLPRWGSDRPSTLVWLAVDYSGGTRKLLGADDKSEILRVVGVSANERGVPLILPLMDSVDREKLGFVDVCGRFPDKIQAASARYQADAVLSGCARRTSSAGLVVEWELYFGGARERWSGRVGNGIHRVADTFAATFADRAEGPGSQIVLMVSGMDSFHAYGQVSQYLTNLTLIDKVSVEEAFGQTVRFLVAVRGDIRRLEDAIAVGRLLGPLPAPLLDPGAVHLRPTLSYLYKP